MRRLFLVVTAACACAWLAEGAVSNRSPDRDGVGTTTTTAQAEHDVRVAAPSVEAPGVAGPDVGPATRGSGNPNTSTTLLPIQCTANGEGISYSVEKCNETDKTILEVTVHDTYTAKVPLGASPTRTPVTEKTTQPEPDTSEDEEYDDYPFFEEPIVPHSINAEAARRFMILERRKAFASFTSNGVASSTSPTTTTARTRTIARWFPFRRFHQATVPSQFLWGDFCADAAKDEDDEPFRVPGGDINPKYEAVPGRGYYRFHARPRTWEQARRVCEREGAHLAVPNSADEAHMLQDIHNRCPNILKTHFNDYQYIGVHDAHDEGVWITVFGEKLNETGYVRWAHNQPDNAHIYGENCLTLNRWANFNDVPCSTELPFTCEHL